MITIFERLGRLLADRLDGTFDDGTLTFRDTMKHEDPDQQPEYSVELEQVEGMRSLVAIDGVVLLANDDHIVKYLTDKFNLGD